tara:strand:+ start:3013 stop:3630 length:618 start_codon:yes stop_codon:yes gene_type:complete
MNFNNTCWTFKLDHVHTYSYVENFLSKKECEKIIEIGKKLNLHSGKARTNISNFKNTKNKPELNFKIRKSNNSFIYPNEDTFWLYKKLVDSLTDLNNKFFKFDITAFNEGLQFTNYTSPSGHYNMHTDNLLNGPIRKLSLTIQLSDPLEYEGGNLELISQPEPYLAKKEQGTLSVFPSYVLHKVSPVTKGERNSLVGWVTGPNFK